MLSLCKEHPLVVGGCVATCLYCVWKAGLLETLFAAASTRRATASEFDSIRHVLQEKLELPQTAGEIYTFLETGHEFDYETFDGSPDTIDDMCASVCTRENIAAPHDRRVIADCLQRIASIKKLCAELTKLSATKFDSDNAQHEAKLMSLWSALKPSVKLSARKTKEWGEIGFQGTDPASDFRGMGLLGLEQLLYYESVQLSQGDGVDPLSGFPFAITGINVTSILLNAIRSGQLNVFLLKTTNCDVAAVHEMYCTVLTAFVREYIGTNPAGLMDFPPFKTQFEKTRFWELFQ